MLLKQLAELIGPGEKLILTITAPKPGSAEVLIQPAFKSALAEGSDAVKQARAALAMPLKLSDDIESLDSNLMEVLVAYGAQRAGIKADIPALLALKEQGKATKAAIDKGGEKAETTTVGVEADKSDDKPEADPVAASATMPDAGNPYSLI